MGTVAQGPRKVGRIDVGGGLRGAYGAGVLDRCIDDGIRFDYCIGVSAGSANVAAFLAGQKGRNLRFYADYSARPAFMGLGALRASGSFLDVEYVYGTLSQEDGEDPLDVAAVREAGVPCELVATDARTGAACYFDVAELSAGDLGAIKASSSVPVACKPYRWRGREFCDGGLSDPIPLRRALGAGCERVVVVLTRPKAFRRKALRDKAAARLAAREHPRMAELLELRASTYNAQLDYALVLERSGVALVVAPDDIEGMGTLTRDRNKIVALYAKGYADGAAIAPFMRRS